MPLLIFSATSHIPITEQRLPAQAPDPAGRKDLVLEDPQLHEKGFKSDEGIEYRRDLVN